MKTIVIAHDGSECSEAIFTELQHAGLPPGLDAHVVSVAELWAPAAADPATWAPLSADPPFVRSAEAEKLEAMHRAGALAEQGAARLQAANAGARTAFSSAPPAGNTPTPQRSARWPRRWPCAPTAR